MEPTVTEVLELWDNATAEAQAKALDYLVRCNSPDAATREQARAELFAEVDRLQ